MKVFYTKYVGQNRFLVRIGLFTVTKDFTHTAFKHTSKIVAQSSFSLMIIIICSIAA